ncbi:hypothetical protein OIO90_004224 [Microbotryomycetes sp. JL221]|nr:hypothetical protein OIO90_004224 [Microbotryomycetes sp. JL221]
MVSKELQSALQRLRDWCKDDNELNQLTDTISSLAVDVVDKHAPDAFSALKTIQDISKLLTLRATETTTIYVSELDEKGRESRGMVGKKLFPVLGTVLKASKLAPVIKRKASGGSLSPSPFEDILEYAIEHHAVNKQKFINPQVVGAATLGDLICKPDDYGLSARALELAFRLRQVLKPNKTDAGRDALARWDKLLWSSIGDGELRKKIDEMFKAATPTEFEDTIAEEIQLMLSTDRFCTFTITEVAIEGADCLGPLEEEAKLAINHHTLSIILVKVINPEDTLEETLEIDYQDVESWVVDTKSHVYCLISFVCSRPPSIDLQPVTPASEPMCIKFNLSSKDEAALRTALDAHNLASMENVELASKSRATPSTSRESPIWSTEALPDKPSEGTRKQVRIVERSDNEAEHMIDKRATSNGKDLSRQIQADHYAKADQRSAASGEGQQQQQKTRDRGNKQNPLSLKVKPHTVIKSVSVPGPLQVRVSSPGHQTNAGRQHPPRKAKNQNETSPDLPDLDASKTKKGSNPPRNASENTQSSGEKRKAHLAQAPVPPHLKEAPAIPVHKPVQAAPLQRDGANIDEEPLLSSPSVPSPRRPPAVEALMRRAPLTQVLKKRTSDEEEDNVPSKKSRKAPWDDEVAPLRQPLGHRKSDAYKVDQAPTIRRQTPSAELSPERHDPPQVTFGAGPPSPGSAVVRSPFDELDAATLDKRRPYSARRPPADDAAVTYSIRPDSIDRHRKYVRDSGIGLTDLTRSDNEVSSEDENRLQAHLIKMAQKKSPRSLKWLVSGFADKDADEGQIEEEPSGNIFGLTGHDGRAIPPPLRQAAVPASPVALRSRPRVSVPSRAFEPLYVQSERRRLDARELQHQAAPKKHRSTLTPLVDFSPSTRPVKRPRWTEPVEVARHDTGKVHHAPRRKPRVDSKRNDRVFASLVEWSKVVARRYEIDANERAQQADDSKRRVAMSFFNASIKVQQHTVRTYEMTQRYLDRLSTISKFAHQLARQSLPPAA